MTTPQSEQGLHPMPQTELDEIASRLSAHEGLVYVLSARDDIADSGIDAFGPDAGNACWLVASLSHLGPEPHRIGTEADPIPEEESDVLACVERLRNSSANYILAWRRTAEHAVRVAYSPGWLWQDVRAELSDLVLFHHPVP